MQSSVPLQPQLNHRILLVNLRKSIELWFLGRRDHVYEEWDDLYSDIQNAIVAIISDGLQLSMQSPNKARLKKLEEDLQWLRASVRTTSRGSTPNSDSLTTRSFFKKWVQENLKENYLCSCLQMLVTDKDILNTYYTEYSYLRSEEYATALFICISAVELNRSSLLTQIDPKLFTESILHFKRTISHPNLSMSPPKRTPVKIGADSTDSSTSVKHLRLRSTIRKWNSLPALKQQEPNKRARSQTLGNVRDVSVNIGRLHKALNIQDGKTGTNHQHSESLRSSSSGCSKTTTESQSSSSVNIELIKCDDIKIWEDHSFCQNNTETQANKISPVVGTSSLDMTYEMHSQSRSSPSPINSFLSNIFSVSSFRGQSGSSWNESSTSMCYSSSAQNDSVLNSFLPKCGEKLPPRKTTNLFEDSNASLHGKMLPGGQSVGDQSLAAFLQTTQFSRHNTELERENAHFRICEAIISAIERIKCQKMESDRTVSIPSKVVDESEDNAGTSSQVYECLDANYRKYSTDLSEDLNSQPPNKLEESADISEHMPYAELGENSLDDLRSAENIGLSLISKFNDKHLPKISDLKWLVSEEDTPQKLLPMPQQSNNPDDNVMPMVTRGTRYWAPPRQQIIFTNHPTPNKKVLIQKQNHRCAGCGMRVSTTHVKSFRYCTYLGKYHCTGCHRNQISAIPSKVLHLYTKYLKTQTKERLFNLLTFRWDFNFYPVSLFAYRLLEQMWTYPLFYVPDLNPALYAKSRALRNARLKRMQTQFVKEFITACRFAENERMYFASVPDYISTDPDTWSMSDLIDVQTKTIHKSLQDLINKCEDHIFNCLLCTARGFICEFCRREAVIYPWQHKVLRCDKCGSCFHQSCWKAQFDCPKCQRLKSRQLDA